MKPDAKRRSPTASADRLWASTPMLEDLATSPSAVKSAARAFRIIEFFDEVRRPARANEIAERLGFPQSSTSVLLNSMVRLGYLDFDQTRKSYLPSLRVAVLSTWRDTGCFRDGSMLDLLDELADFSGLSACLSAISGIHVRYLQVVQATKPGNLHITLAARAFAVSSAAGLVLLTAATTAEVQRLVYRTKAQNEDAVIELSTGAVLERIEKARSQGYYMSEGLVIPGNGAVAVALPAEITGGWQNIAISIAGRLEDVIAGEHEFVTKLHDGVARLRRRVGG